MLGSEGRAGEGARAAGRRPLPVAAVLLGAIAMLLVGCGDEDTSDADRRAVAQATERLQLAFAERDLPELCARMTRRASRQAGRIAYGRPRACVPDVRRAVSVIGRDVWEELGQLPLRAVEVDGDEATATVAFEGHEVDVPLARENGRWKLDSFFGTSAARLDARPSSLSGKGDAVTVTVAAAGARARCADFLSSYPRVVGGCVMSLHSPAVDISVLTPFGHFRFALCRAGQRLAIDGSGDTWTSRVSFEGDSDGRCGDVRPCGDRRGSLPWKGRIYARPDGGLSQRTDVCLDTGLGYYEGEVVTRLVRRGGGWQVVADYAEVGRSGFTLAGRLEEADAPETDRPLDIRPS